jgi:hypothetical protein
MKQDKVYRFYEYLKENMNDVPEKYVENVLRKLKTKFEKMFAFDTAVDGEVKKFGEVSKEEEKKEKVSLKDFNLELQSCEFSKYSKEILATPRPTLFSFNSGYCSYTSSPIPHFNI